MPRKAKMRTLPTPNFGDRFSYAFAMRASGLALRGRSTFGASRSLWPSQRLDSAVAWSFWALVFATTAHLYCEKGGDASRGVTLRVGQARDFGNFQTVAIGCRFSLAQKWATHLWRSRWR